MLPNPPRHSRRGGRMPEFARHQVGTQTSKNEAQDTVAGGVLYRNSDGSLAGDSRVKYSCCSRVGCALVTAG